MAKKREFGSPEAGEDARHTGTDGSYLVLSQRRDAQH